MRSRAIGAPMAIVLGAWVASAFAMQPRHPHPDTAVAATNKPNTAVEQAPLPKRGEVKLKYQAKINQISAIPDGFWWDSGEQQCQSGNRKIVYHYRMQQSSKPGFQWELWFHIKSEDTDWNGHWKPSNQLYKLYYFFTYPGGFPVTLEASVDKDVDGTGIYGKSDVSGVLFRGNDYYLFDIRVLTAKRSGGGHGLEVTWPNTQGCV